MSRRGELLDKMEALHDLFEEAVKQACEDLDLQWRDFAGSDVTVHQNILLLALWQKRLQP